MCQPCLLSTTVLWCYLNSIWKRQNRIQRITSGLRKSWFFIFTEKQVDADLLYSRKVLYVLLNAMYGSSHFNGSLLHVKWVRITCWSKCCGQTSRAWTGTFWEGSLVQSLVRAQLEMHRCNRRGILWLVTHDPMSISCFAAITVDESRWQWQTFWSLSLYATVKKAEPLLLQLEKLGATRVCWHCLTKTISSGVFAMN